jgi:hypothetical protein
VAGTPTPGIAATRRRSPWISGAIAIGAVVAAAAACLAIAVYRDLDTRIVPPDAAQRAFDDVRQQLAGGRPLLDVDAQLQVAVHRDGDLQPQPLVALHSLSYAPRTQKLVRADLPMWLLRVATADGRVRLLDIGIIQGNGEHVTLDDLRRHGPGLVIDAQLPERRVLVWTE